MLNLTEAQKTCPHIFVGRADGVHCTRCGLHLTAQQYHELLHPPESPQDAPNNEGDKELTEPEKAAQTTTEPPQAKPKRTRKKKETVNE